MFDEANKILKKEKEILERDFSHILDSDSLSDEVLYDFRRYSILVALKSEVFKAKLIIYIAKYNFLGLYRMIKSPYRLLRRCLTMCKMKFEALE